MKPVPPETLRLVDSEQFFAAGSKQIDLMVKRAGLEPSSWVLDPGCGAGRHALALADLLDPARGGRYIGLDVERSRIDWCRTAITPVWNHLRFFHLDARSQFFNPDGHIDLGDSDFQLPVRDASFDLIILWSLFSHVPPDGAEFYFREIARLLTADGAAFVTGYLWTLETADEVAVGNPRFPFPHDRGIWRVQDSEEPEHAVSYKQYWWDERIAAHGLRTEWLHLGNWRSEPTHGQDMMVVRRA